MIRSTSLLLAAACTLLLAGCLPGKSFTPTDGQTLKGYYEKSVRNPATNSRFTAFIVPVRGGNAPPCCRTGLNAIELTITNTGRQGLRVDWSRTTFLRDGRPDGGFFFEDGQTGKPCDAAFQDDLAPSHKLKRTIFPCALAVPGFKTWNTPFTGEVGLLLVVETPDGPANESITVIVGTAP